jgi:hypothetical protein
MREGKLKMILLDLPPRNACPRKVTVTLTETPVKGTRVMRTVYTIEIKVDLNMDDDRQRAAFIKLATEAARAIAGPAVLLAKSPPEISLSERSREGTNTLPLFETTATWNG